MKNKKHIIAVAGTGYVGLSNSVLLAQHNTVYAVDIVPEKVKMINDRMSPIIDKEIQEYLETKELDLNATLDAAEAYANAEFVVIATPTNYDAKRNYFDTSSVETVIKLVKQLNPNSTIVIKSTIPIGFTKLIREKMKLIPTRNMAAYLRKMAIDGYVVHIDTTDIRAQTAELQKIGVNVNQIARRLNSMGPLYTQDVADIKGALAQIWQLQRYILSSQR